MALATDAIGQTAAQSKPVPSTIGSVFISPRFEADVTGVSRNLFHDGSNSALEGRRFVVTLCGSNGNQRVVFGRRTASHKLKNDDV